MGVAISPDAPTAEEALGLRATTGWGMPSVERMQIALNASCAHVTARDAQGRLVGMARAVGDGVMYVYIQDVIVPPDVRGQGIARDLVNDLLARLRAQVGPSASIGLLSVAGLEPFYESLGFMRRPDGRYGAGMVQITP